MNEQIKEKSKFLSVLMYVLYFGGVWGIIEATLGTILHLPGFETLGVFGKSSAIMIPIAFALMAICYKKTNSKYAVFLMGVVAGLIKLSVGFVIGFIDRVYDPAMYIVLESLVMGTALIAVNPDKVVSLKTLLAVIISSTVYQFLYLCISTLKGGSNVFASAEAWASRGQLYLLTINCVAILYTTVFGCIAHFVLVALEKHNVEMKFDLNKFISNPITASVTFALAIAITVSFAALF